MLTSYAVGQYRAGESSVTACPRSYPVNNTRRGVLVAHGAGETSLNWLNPLAVGALQALTNYGYPCLACDFGTTTTNFGNDDSITATGAGWTFLKAGGINAKTDKVILVGGSMGALTALNWARQNLSQVACVVLLCPALDLNDAYANNRGGYQSAIGTAYGVTYPTPLPGLATHSPMAYAMGDLGSLPIGLFPSDDDATASNTAACQTFAASGVGSNITVTSVGAIGHNWHSINLETAGIMRFIDTYGKA